MAKAKVIDTHAHLGECCVFGLFATEEEMLRRMEENGVDATIVQPYPGAKDFLKRHDEIAELCAKHPGRFYGLASLSPHIGRERYQREVERCVKDLKFVAVKLHTIGHGVNPLSEDGNMVFRDGPRTRHSGNGAYRRGHSLCAARAVHACCSEIPRP